MVMTRLLTPLGIVATMALILSACVSEIDASKSDPQPNYQPHSEAEFDRAMLKADVGSVVTVPGPAVQAQPARFYTVLFDLGSDRLNEAGENVINAIADDWGASSANLRVVGHTDSSGGEEYNRNLSERRAKAVGDALGSLGLESHRVKGTGVGEGELLVPTNDGVSEPYNRRVTISVE